MGNKKPNFIFILSDDQGYWSMGCAGNKDIITPNLDRIAAKGLRFKNFFCASPVCSPARASILTGKMPSSHGIQDWIADGHVNESELSAELREKINAPERPWQYDWPRNQLKGAHAVDYLEGQTGYTELLAAAGYTCALSGKWHMGDAGKPQKGFTWWRVNAMGGDNYKYPVVLENGEFVLKDNVYITDYITDNALEFLDSQDGEKPFYLNVAYTAPHAPWQRSQHKEEQWMMYEGCSFESFPDEPMHKWSGMQFKTEEDRRAYRLEAARGYCAAVTAMDECIGKILDKLEEKGLAENTVIVFSADNGMSMGHHGIYGKGNGTFPQNMYETAVKVPTLMYVPGMKGGEVCDKLLSHYDLFPTVVELAGLNNPVKDLCGGSFAPLLRGCECETRDEVIICSEYGPVRMIRTDEWKYIHRYPYGEHELYNIKDDPDERENLYGKPEYEAVTEELKGRLEKWFYANTDPSRDGRAEPNRGIGQTYLVGPAAAGKKNFR